MNIFVKKRNDGLNVFRDVVNAILITIFMGVIVGSASVLYFITVLILRFIK